MNGEKRDTEMAIAKRGKEKAKKPKFRRQESWRYRRLKERWRRPRGLDNKIRRKIKGWPAAPNSGYRGPRFARGLHPSGLREIRIFSVDELYAVNPELEAARIPHTVGGRKKTEIITRAREMGIRILNPREFKELEESVSELEKQ